MRSYGSEGLRVGRLYCIVDVGDQLPRRSWDWIWIWIWARALARRAVDLHFESIADLHLYVLDAVGGKGGLGLAGIFLVELEACDGPLGSHGMRPQQRGISHVYADFEDYDFFPRIVST